MSFLNLHGLPAKLPAASLLEATEISDAHIKLINSSWDYHPDPEHTIASISEPNVQAFADTIKVNAPFITGNPRREERWD
jgi:hypothetical protein